MANVLTYIDICKDSTRKICSNCYNLYHISVKYIYNFLTDWHSWIWYVFIPFLYKNDQHIFYSFSNNDPMKPSYPFIMSLMFSGCIPKGNVGAVQFSSWETDYEFYKLALSYALFIDSRALLVRYCWWGKWGRKIQVRLKVRCIYVSSPRSIDDKGWDLLKIFM